MTSILRLSDAFLALGALLAFGTAGALLAFGAAGAFRAFGMHGGVAGAAGTTGAAGAPSDAGITLLAAPGLSGTENALLATFFLAGSAGASEGGAGGRTG